MQAVTFRSHLTALEGAVETWRNLELTQVVALMREGDRWMHDPEAEGFKPGDEKLARLPEDRRRNLIEASFRKYIGHLLDKDKDEVSRFLYLHDTMLEQVIAINPAEADLPTIGRIYRLAPLWRQFDGTPEASKPKPSAAIQEAADRIRSQVLTDFEEAGTEEGEITEEMVNQRAREKLLEINATSPTREALAQNLYGSGPTEPILQLSAFVYPRRVIDDVSGEITTCYDISISGLDDRELAAIQQRTWEIITFHKEAERANPSNDS